MNAKLAKSDIVVLSERLPNDFPLLIYVKIRPRDPSSILYKAGDSNQLDSALHSKGAKLTRVLPHQNQGYISPI